MRQIQKIEKHYYKNPDNTVKTEYHVFIDGFTYDCKDKLSRSERDFWSKNKNEVFHCKQIFHF